MGLPAADPPSVGPGGLTTRVSWIKLLMASTRHYDLRSLSFLVMLCLLVPRGQGPSALRAARLRISDAFDERVDPHHGFIGVRENIETLGGRRVEVIPPVTHGQGRWPRLLLSIGEQSPARRRDRAQVKVLSSIQQLEVDEVAGPVAARGRDGK